MAFAEPRFELSEEELDDRTHVIAVSGEIHVSTAPEFSVRLNDAIERGKTAVVLDLAAVEFIDSTGLSVLLSGLRQVLKPELSIVDLFQYPTIDELARHVSQDGQRPAAQGREPLARRREGESRDIAVVALAGRFPGARSVVELWRNLREGVESIRAFSDDELRAAGVDPAALNGYYVRAGAVLDDIDLFDASFFRCSPREAATIDPQQRLFLECAWEALETAGYDPDRYAGRIGVFAGMTVHTDESANAAYRSTRGSPSIRGR